MKLIKEKQVVNFDHLISHTVLKQFAKSKFHTLNTSRRERILVWQDLYVDFINKRNSN